MIEYVTRGDHLKLCMGLLRDEAKMIQYEGFHVFKVSPPCPRSLRHPLTKNEVFVANPKKSDHVNQILIQNRTRLLNFLPGFLSDRKDDEQFLDEKAFIIRTIQLLPEKP